MYGPECGELVQVWPTLSNDLRSIPPCPFVADHNSSVEFFDWDLPNSTVVGTPWDAAASAELILPEGTNGATAFA